jgi:hypothetical protein
VKTASKAIAVLIVHSSRNGSRDIEHIGSAHRPEDVEVLKAVAALTRENHRPTGRSRKEAAAVKSSGLTLSVWQTGPNRSQTADRSGLRGLGRSSLVRCARQEFVNGPGERLALAGHPVARR